MKVKVELEKHETLDEADELLEKALHAKHEDSHGERYADPILNEFHDYLNIMANQTLTRIKEQIEGELQRASSARYHK